MLVSSTLALLCQCHHPLLLKTRLFGFVLRRYSCRYGNFLFNSEQERLKARVAERCSSLWTSVAGKKRDRTFHIAAIRFCSTIALFDLNASIRRSSPILRF